MHVGSLLRSSIVVMALVLAGAMLPGCEQRETLVTVDFLAKGKATEIVVRHEGLPDEKATNAHTGGWTTILERLSGGAGNAAHCGAAG